MTTKIEAYVFNNSCFDDGKINNINIRLWAETVVDELSATGYNQDPKGNVSLLGRIYANKEYAEARIAKAGPTFGFFIIQIPEDSVINKFSDPLDSRIQYYNVQSETIPEIIGLQTVSSQHDISPEFKVVNMKESPLPTLPEKVGMQQAVSHPLRQLFSQLNPNLNKAGEHGITEAATVDTTSRLSAR